MTEAETIENSFEFCRKMNGVWLTLWEQKAALGAFRTSNSSTLNAGGEFIGNLNETLNAVYGGLGAAEKALYSLRKGIEKARAAMPYDDYLNTPWWRGLAAEVKMRADNRCQICGATGVPLEAHHNTYDRRGYEAWTDLIAVCRECHQMIYERDQKRKEGDSSSAEAQADDTGAVLADANGGARVGTEGNDDGLAILHDVAAECWGEKRWAGWRVRWLGLYSLNWVIGAIEEAISKGKRHPNYVDAILKNWATQGEMSTAAGTEGGEDEPVRAV